MASKTTSDTPLVNIDPKSATLQPKPLQESFPPPDENSIPKGNRFAQSTWLTLEEGKSRKLAEAKLRQSSTVSTLFAGFALVAIIEMDIEKEVPEIYYFGLMFTAMCLVAVHLIAFMISTYFLPHVEAINNREDCADTLDSLQSGPQYQTDSEIGALPALKEFFICKTPTDPDPITLPYENSISFYITTAWMCSTVIGIFLFIIELALIVWVKYYYFKSIVIATIIILSIVLLLLIRFVFLFKAKLESFKDYFTYRMQLDGNAETV